MIKAVRVDHRLVHGQVAFSWTKFLEVDCILLASDALMKDELKMAAMKIAKPTGIKLVMKNIDDSIKALNSGVTDKYKLFIIVESIEDSYRLVKNVPAIKAINIGGMLAKEGRREIAKAVFISKEDEEKIRELNALGIEQYVQLVPNDTRKDVMNLL